MSIEKEKLLKAFRSPDEKLLFSKAYDRALLCEKRGASAFSDFLDPLKADMFAAIIERENIAQVLAYGGAIGCERIMLGFYSEHNNLHEDEFPINPMEIVHNNPKLTHRDFLGSILGTGINRDKLGDIFLYESKAIAFLSAEISDFVCGALEKVANTPVRRSIICDSYLIAPFVDSNERELVVSSMRLDTVISALFRLSRGKSVKMIEGEKAYINWQCVKTPSRIVNEGDNITLRGLGRAQIISINSRTRSDNIRLTVKELGVKQ